MPAERFKSVDHYIAQQPESSRPVLERVRSALGKALPGAEETISYQIPAYRLNGRTVLYFAGWKEHYSIYPATAAMVAKFGDAFAPYEVNSKGTIRFPWDQPVPVRLIGRIAKFRAKEVEQVMAARAAASRR